MRALIGLSKESKNISASSQFIMIRNCFYLTASGETKNMAKKIRKLPALTILILCVPTIHFVITFKSSDEIICFV